jgi:hypothetical protein
MTFGTSALRTLSFIGAAASMFWLIAFYWSAFVDPPPIVLVGIVAASIVVVVSLVLVKRFPAILAVPAQTESFAFVRRLVIAAVVSYIALAIAVYATAITVFFVANRLEGDAQVAAAILALWVPIWLLPLVSAVAVWWWSRRDSAV